MNSRLKKSGRLISTFVCVVYFGANCALAHALETNVWTERRKPIPSPALTQKTVFYIQDIHQNLEAQQSIHQTISRLLEKEKIGVVGLEAEFRPLDLRPFQRFPKHDVVEKVSSFLLRENRISGPIYSALNHSSFPPVIGVDDQVHYEANVEAYRRAVESQKQTLAWLGGIKRGVDQEKQKLFTGALKEVDARITAYHQGRESLESFVKTLSTYSKTTRPNLNRFLMALKLEGALSIPDIEREKEKLKRISSTTDSIDWKQFPHLKAYLDYQSASKAIDIDQLFNDMFEAENEITDRLAQSTREKELIEQSKWLRLAQKLVNFSMTPKEWNSYLHFKRVPSPGTGEGGRRPGEGKKRSTSLALTLPLSPRGEGTRLLDFERFYSHAESRDEAMASNLLKAMSERKASNAILITGGFHSKGIEKRLNNAGMRVVKITPTLTRIESDDSSHSLQHFLTAKPPLQQLFEGERLFLSMRAAQGVSEIPALAAGLTPTTPQQTFEALAPDATPSVVTATPVPPASTRVTVETSAGRTETTMEVSNGQLIEVETKFIEINSDLQAAKDIVAVLVASKGFKSLLRNFGGNADFGLGTNFDIKVEALSHFLPESSAWLAEALLPFLQDQAKKQSLSLAAYRNQITSSTPEGEIARSRIIFKFSAPLASIVNQTQFFRYKNWEIAAFIHDHIAGEMKSGKSRYELSVRNIGTATGSEIYSVASVIYAELKKAHAERKIAEPLNDWLNRWDVRIEAYDISIFNLMRTRLGMYDLKEWKSEGIDPDIVEVNDSYAVFSPIVRRWVRPIYMDLEKPESLELLASRPSDMTLLLNVVMYLSSLQQKMAVLDLIIKQAKQRTRAEVVFAHGEGIDLLEVTYVDGKSTFSAAMRETKRSMIEKTDPITRTSNDIQTIKWLLFLRFFEDASVLPVADKFASFPSDEVKTAATWLKTKTEKQQSGYLLGMPFLPLGFLDLPIEPFSDQFTTLMFGLQDWFATGFSWVLLVILCGAVLGMLQVDPNYNEKRSLAAAIFKANQTRDSDQELREVLHGALRNKQGNLIPLAFELLTITMPPNDFDLLTHRLFRIITGNSIDEFRPRLIHTTLPPIVNQNAASTIYTLTLNPAVNVTFDVENFEDPERFTSYQVQAGGKGIDVSIGLRQLGLVSIPMGLIGGDEGRLVRTFLQELKLPDHHLTPIRNSNRMELIFHHQFENLRLLSNNGPEIFDNEFDEVQQKLLSALKPGDNVVIAGSLAPGIPIDALRDLILKAKEKGAYVVLDSRGNWLKHAILAKPDVLAVNAIALASMLNREPSFYTENLPLLAREAAYFCSLGIETVIISMGAKGMIMANQNGTWWAKPPNVPVLSGVGSGSMVKAGYLYGLFQTNDPIEALRWATAASAATVSLPGTGLASINETKALLNQVEIERIRPTAGNPIDYNSPELRLLNPNTQDPESAWNSLLQHMESKPRNYTWVVGNKILDLEKAAKALLIERRWNAALQKVHEIMEFLKEHPLHVTNESDVDRLQKIKNLYMWTFYLVNRSPQIQLHVWNQFELLKPVPDFWLILADINYLLATNQRSLATATDWWEKIMQWHGLVGAGFPGEKMYSLKESQGEFFKRIFAEFDSFEAWGYEFNFQQNSIHYLYAAVRYVFYFSDNSAAGQPFDDGNHRVASVVLNLLLATHVGMMDLEIMSPVINYGKGVYRPFTYLVPIRHNAKLTTDTTGTKLDFDEKGRPILFAPVRPFEGPQLPKLGVTQLGEATQTQGKLSLPPTTTSPLPSQQKTTNTRFKFFRKILSAA